jgi:hypothetical protein
MYAVPRLMELLVFINHENDIQMRYILPYFKKRSSVLACSKVSVTVPLSVCISWYGDKLFCSVAFVCCKDRPGGYVFC